MYNNFKVFLDQLSSGHASKEEKEEMDRQNEKKKKRQEIKERQN